MNRQLQLQNDLRKVFGSLAVGSYAWIVAIFFGMILLDVAYAKSLRGSSGMATVATVFSDVSDYLLLVGALAVLTGLSAIVLSWNSRWARNCLIGSLLVLATEFLVPVFLAGNVPGSGHWIRITINAAASILAFLGAYSFYTSGPKA